MGKVILGGAATCFKGFVNCFLRVTQAVALFCSSCHAMLPKQAKETFRTHITKPSKQVAAPPGTVETGYKVAFCPRGK